MSICHKEFILSHSGHEESYIDQNGKNARKNNNGLEQLCKDRSPSQSLTLGTACCLKVSFPFFAGVMLCLVLFIRLQMLQLEEMWATDSGAGNLLDLLDVYCRMSNVTMKHFIMAKYLWEHCVDKMTYGYLCFVD